MNFFSLLIVVSFSFLLSYLLSKYFSVKMRKMGIIGRDVHKKGTPEVSEMGGLAVFFSIPALLFLLLLLSDPLDERIFAIALSLVFVGLVGIFDDIFGLNHKLKPTLIVAASLPLMYVLFERTSVQVPFVGSMNIGLLYPLVAVPLAVTTSSNFTNIFAGFNGLESGVGFLATSTVSLCALLKNEQSIGMLGLGIAFSFLGLMILNKYPSKLFTGDTGTLLSGASIAAIGLAAGVEFAAIVVSIPAAIDFALKMQNRNPFKQRSSFGDTRINEDGSLSPPPYPSLAHAFMIVSPINEKNLVKMLLLTEFLYCAVAVSVQYFLLG
jgi:UDP-N-acetylglucosamine--dolichyl-phosphate N-acetylglucosaminephosphotransferase